MAEQSLLVLDEGTTSTRAILYGLDGGIGGIAQRPLSQFYPAPGQVEHDAAEILSKTLECAREMVAKAGGAARIRAIGITNQRETVVAWDRATGVAISRAIVWQDRRTAPACDALRAAGHEALVQSRSGLLLDPYFSATKIAWILEHIPAARALGPRLAVGTIDSWLVWNLTGGLHITDASNASRTALMALDAPLGAGGWDAELCELFGVPPAILPEITGNAQIIGHTAAEIFGAPIAIAGMAGDQQAATIGQGCLNPGDTKLTLGTGAFILTNTGSRIPHSAHRLLTTVLSDIAGTRHFALEGSIFAAGSLIQWLRDNLGLLAHAADSEGLARSVPDTGGVQLVPALAGLGAPHWRPEARAAITGMSFATTRAHIIRAALEAMANQARDLQTAFAADGAAWQSLRIDGAMSANGFVAQDLAHMLAVPVLRPADVETTARGAAMLAVVGSGVFATLADAAAAMSAPTVRFTPDMPADVRDKRARDWSKALARV